MQSWNVLLIIVGTVASTLLGAYCFDIFVVSKKSQIAEKGQFNSPCRIYNFFLNAACSGLGWAIIILLINDFIVIQWNTAEITIGQVTLGIVGILGISGWLPNALARGLWPQS